MRVAFHTIGFALVLQLAFVARIHAAFGVTSSGGRYEVDTGGGLVFKVNQSNGDITSLVYEGIEYQSTPKFTHVGTGLGAATVSATTYGTNFIKITCTSTDTNVWPGTLTQYLMVRNGESIIYLGTHATSMPASGTLRWISRLNPQLLPNGPAASDFHDAASCIENCANGGDVFLMADGTTRSKYYSRHRAMELTCNGVTGTNVGAWIWFGSRESDSSGPFYRDVENSNGGDEQDIYNVMFSGHAATEPVRLNVLYGPYALVFNHGTLPATPLEVSWIEGLNLLGWVSPTNRGAVRGVAWGIPGGFQAVVKFANTNAQYWAVVGTNGTFLCPQMKPGDYTAILCKGELEVATNTVTVAAGQTNDLNLTSTESSPTCIFRIGEWDGTPLGFLNADKILTMHPSDVRMSNWNSGPFVVGVDPTGKFPMAGWKDASVTTNLVVQFPLAADQIQNLTLRYGITTSHAGGRPKPQINSWLPGNPVAPPDIGTRNLTLGSWRAYNYQYNFTVPASGLVVGTNRLTLSIISGSTPTNWLSPSCVYDAVELDIPNTSPALPAVPGELSATALNGSHIQLAWADTATNEVNFLLERSTNGENFNVIAALAADLTNYTDTSLAPGTTNYYRLRTFNAGGYSSYTATRSVVTTLPRFTSAQILGGSLILTGTGGPAGRTYLQLISSNVALPLNSWAVAATNVFDSSGSFIQTNLMNPSGAQFFRLKIN